MIPAGQKEGIGINKSEARGILAQQLANYRQYSYSDLVKMIGTNSVIEVIRITAIR